MYSFCMFTKIYFVDCRWLEWHQRLQKLNQEAVVEASNLKDEHVKETLVCFGKVNIKIL